MLARRTSIHCTALLIGAFELMLMSSGCGTSDHPAMAAAARPAGTGTVTVQLYGFDNDRGQALVSLYLGPTGFPNDPERAHGRQTARIEGKRASVVFRNVPAGEFAISAFHDENRDFKLNTGTFGIPKEDYGASRDARRRFGPPEYDDAKLTLAPDQHLTLQVRIH